MPLLSKSVPPLIENAADFLSSLAGKMNFENLETREIISPSRVYHSTDSKPQISTEELRLIPESISTSPDNLFYTFGQNNYAIDLPTGVRYGSVEDIFDVLGKNSDSESPLAIGKILRKYGALSDLDAMYVKNIPGISGGDFAITNPKLMENARLIGNRKTGPVY